MTNPCYAQAHNLLYFAEMDKFFSELRSDHLASSW